MQVSGNIDISGDKGKSCQICTIKPALMFCSCTAPNIALCADCVAVHFGTAGSHRLEMLPPAPPKRNKLNTQCMMCKVKEADHICTCSFPPTPLCLQCAEKHEETDFLNRHYRMNTKALSSYTSPEYLLNFEKRQQGVRDAERNLLKQVGKAREQVEVHFDGIMDSVARFKKEVVHDLEELGRHFEEEVNRAMTEVKEHIYENKFESDTWLASVIWNYSLEPVDLRCFTFNSDDYAVLEAIKQSTSLNLELSGKSSSDIVLPFPTKDKLMKWDSRLKTFITPVLLSTPIAVNRESVWSDIGDGCLFVSGCDQPFSANAYLINTLDGVVRSLPLMQEARKLHGSIVYNGEVCLFGGYSDKTLRTCELFSFQKYVWSQLPNMHEPRSHCTPCRLEHRVFLAGGLGASRVECFDWKTRTFTQLQLDAPSGYISASFVYHEELIVLQAFQYYKWKVDSSETGFARMTTKRIDYYFANFPIPVCRDNVYVFSSYNNVVVQLKLPEIEVEGTYPCLSN